MRGTGFDLLDDYTVTCQIEVAPKSYESVDVEVLGKSENELVCKFPEKIGEEQVHRSVDFMISDYAKDFRTNPEAMDKHRSICATILPE